MTENATLTQQLHEKDKELLDKDDQLHQLGRLHQEKLSSQKRQQKQLNQSLQDKDRLLRQREDEIISKNGQLQDKDGQIQQTNHSLQRQMEQLQQQLSQQSTPPLSPQAWVRGRQLQREDRRKSYQYSHHSE